MQTEMPPTDEQAQIINSLELYDKIGIIAFAGAGKTSTLFQIAESMKGRGSGRQKKNILYLAFNKAIATEAKDKFPENTLVITTHAFALSKVGPSLRFKKTEKGFFDIRNDYKPSELSGMIGISDFRNAAIVGAVFDEWCNSDIKSIDLPSMQEITKKTSISTMISSVIGGGGTPNKKTKDRYLSILSTKISELFTGMEEGKFLPTHSFYLKYFQVNLHKFIDAISYDAVLLDEAQDTNMVTFDIFKNIPGKKILVGDPHQSIYSFRGSTNIFNIFETDKNFHLTKSFRFGPDIASFADNVLSRLKGEEFSLVSARPNREKVLNPTRAYISRRNSTLIEKIIELRARKEQFVLLRDVRSVFSLVSSVRNFQKWKNRGDFVAKQKIEDFFLLSFGSVKELIDHAEMTEDQEIKTAIKLADEHGDDIFNIRQLAEDMKKAHNPDTTREALILTTAHTSKGKGWDEVEISEDFSDLAEVVANTELNSAIEFSEMVKSKPDRFRSEIEEVNLFYVATTRAKINLRVSGPNSVYFKAPDDKFDELFNSSIRRYAGRNIEKPPRKDFVSGTLTEALGAFKSYKNI